ncbi:MAG: 4-hydroxy-3-methylbut-2-enyl diphosphate reductase [Elusimicrobia bacterium]|nr:4-hydroxy-3-methylbut-2-enyl diphosphate reductase [Elusimicrobiota bacterium]
MKKEICKKGHNAPQGLIPKITEAKNAGFCFGVKRAVRLAEESLKKGVAPVYALGPIIHNPQEVGRLEKAGIKTLKSPSVSKGTLILRTHGIPLCLHYKLLKKPELKIVDATCPFVTRAQNVIKKIAPQAEVIVIVGEKEHPEVKALVSYGMGKCKVIENVASAQKIKKTKDIIYIVSQTTQTPENFKKVVNVIKKVAKVKTYNTICRATFDRQSAAQRLAGTVDIMLVVGGKNSGNTRRLYEICSGKTKTYHIESAKDINAKWFKNKKNVGITAGASTPDWVIAEVRRRVKELSLAVVTKNKEK